MAMNIKKGDTIVVLSGKDKGKQGKVLGTVPKSTKIVAEGINIDVYKRQALSRESGKGLPGRFLEILGRQFETYRPTMRDCEESEIPHGKAYLRHDGLLDERYSTGNSQ